MLVIVALLLLLAKIVIFISSIVVFVEVLLSVLTVFTRANLILVSLCNIVVVVVVVFVVCFDSYQIINESQQQQIGSGY